MEAIKEDMLILHVNVTKEMILNRAKWKKRISWPQKFGVKALLLMLLFYYLKGHFQLNNRMVL